MTIELVTWLDAETRDAWRSHEKMTNACTSRSIEAQAVGFLLTETDDRVVLVGMRNDETSAAAIVIPKAAITKRVVLSEASEPINAIDLPLSDHTNGYGTYAMTHGGYTPR